MLDLTPDVQNVRLAGMKLLFALILMASLAAHAQVRKCVKDGKTVYSDVMCTDTTAKETAIDTSKNTLDHSGLRKLAADERALAAAAAFKQKADAAKEKRLAPGKDVCGNPIDLSHRPSERLKNERERCSEARLREYNRPSD